MRLSWSLLAVLLCLTALFSSPRIIHNAQAATAPTFGLDGKGVDTSDWGSHQGYRSQLLTTTQPNDVIILIVESHPASPGQITAVTDGNGLTFTQRSVYPSDTGSASLYEYYAVASVPLDSDNITVVCDCLPFGGMLVFAVSGANVLGIFDANPSIPAAVTCPSNGCGTCQDDPANPGTCSTSIQTSTIDFVVATVAINDAGDCGAANNQPPAGFTNLATHTFSSIFEVDYMVTNSPQTTVVFNCNGTDAVAITLDAIPASTHAPISINGDSDFTAANGVTGGSGTSDDPYVIAGWTITPVSTPGILVENTGVYFTIREVTVQGSQSTNGNGVVFAGNAHADLEKSQVQVDYGTSGSPTAAVWISLTSDVVLSGNNLNSPNIGVMISSSSWITIVDNLIIGNTNGLKGDSFSNLTVTGNTVAGEQAMEFSNFSGAELSANQLAQSSGGLQITGCDMVNIESNSMGRHADSLYVGNCNNVTVSQNDFPGQCPNIWSCGDWNSPSEHDIMLVGAGNVVVQSNSIAFASVGLLLTPDSTGNQFIGNNIASNSCGVSASQATLDQNTFANNIFQNNNQDYCYS